MRTLDENKRIAIGKAAIHLINTIGFDGASMSKIAKLAEVSPATIYTYFENKEDMLLKLYVMVKTELSQALQKGLKPDMETKAGMYLMFENLIKYFDENRDSFAFMEQFANSPLVSKVCEEYQELFLPVINFTQKGMDLGALKTVPIEYCWLFLFHPTTGFLKRKHGANESLSEEEKNTLFEMTWDAISCN